MAPCSSVSDSSGTSLAGSKSYMAPRPWHSVHAPCGELKEKARGVISGMLMPQSTHASRRENSRSPISTLLMMTMSLGEPEGHLDRIREAALDARPHQQAVHDDLDRVVAAAVEADVLVERAHLAVDAGAREAARAERGQLLLELALAPADDRREHVDPLVRRERQDEVEDLRERLRGDLAAALVAVRRADVGEQQAQVVVDLGDRADGGPGVRGGGLLLDGDRRGEAVDQVDVGLLHLLEELAGVRRQRLDVAALPLGVDRVEGERRLARAGQAGDHDELAARQVNVDVLEVVHPRAANRDPVVPHAPIAACLAGSLNERS